MKFDLILLDYILVIIGLSQIVGIAYLALGKRQRIGFISFLLVAVFNGVAIYRLSEMMAGNHSSYIPYLLILISTLFIIFQSVRTNRNSSGVES